MHATFFIGSRSVCKVLVTQLSRNLPAKSGRLLFRKILRSFQEQPAPLFENINLLVGLELIGFATKYFINLLVKLPHDMEAVEYVQGIWRLFGNDFKLRCPHVAAQKD